jgi:hypothetical protein
VKTVSDSNQLASARSLFNSGGCAGENSVWGNARALYVKLNLTSLVIKRFFTVFKSNIDLTEPRIANFF